VKALLQTLLGDLALCFPRCKCRHHRLASEIYSHL